MADNFRIDTGGDKSYREGALDAAMDVFNENIRSNAVVKAYEHARRDRQAKLEAVRYLSLQVDPDVLSAVINRLATPQLPLEIGIEVESGVKNAHVDVLVDEE